MSVNDKGREKIQRGNGGDWGAFFSGQRVWGTTTASGGLAGKASAPERTERVAQEKGTCRGAFPRKLLR